MLVSTGITGTATKTFCSSGNVSAFGNVKVSLSKFFGTPILSGALFCLAQAVAIIKKTNNVQNGKIAAVLTIQNEVTLKTVEIKNNKIHLISANKNFQEKVYDLKDVQVQGILSGLIRKYN